MQPAPSQTSRVPDGRCLTVVRGVGDRDAGAGRIAGAQQGAEVGLVGDPERGDDQVPPAAVGPRSAGPTDLPPRLLGGAHAAGAGRPLRVLSIGCAVLGRARPSPRPAYDASLSPPAYRETDWSSLDVRALGRRGSERRTGLTSTTVEGIIWHWRADDRARGQARVP